MDTLKRLVGKAKPKGQQTEDGRDQWPTRISYILASMGGAVGMGSLLRYPSVAFLNYGLQWFIPYLMSLFLIAIPLLMLEIAIGQAYRGGPVLAYDHLNKRLKGTGFGVIMIGFAVSNYFVPILAWVMVYFRASFQNPFPWEGRINEFWEQDVLQAPDPVLGDNGWLQYNSTGFLGEITGWNIFTWFVVWLCSVGGITSLGWVVYISMGLPIVLVIILIGGSATLPNAIDGIRMYMGTFRGEVLADGAIWQAACGQIFFSTGVGFGYYTSYASYNAKMANAVQDAWIIGCANSFFEVVAAFAVFSVVGNQELRPEDGVQLGTYTVGFLTYPVAISALPGANFWAVLFFLTIMLIGVSSTFAMLEAVITLLMDTDMAKRIPWKPRVVVTTVTVTITGLISLIYCTGFGYHLLNAVDQWINNVALVFVVWSEAVCSQTVYRWHDVVDQLGLPAFVIYNFGYIGGMIIGVVVAQAVSAPAGAGAGFGIFIVCTIVSVLIARTPTFKAARFWGKNSIASRFWWLAFYQGNQLRHDLDYHIAHGKNWNIPIFHGVLVRYVSGPILMIILSFAYRDLDGVSNDPLHIFGFIVAHCVMVAIALGFVVPRMFDVFIPATRRDEKVIRTDPMEVITGDMNASDSLEAGQGSDSDVPPEKKKDGIVDVK